MPSTVISKMEYDPDTMTLTIIFTSGLVYAYEKVPMIVYEDLKQSRSKGNFLNTKIKRQFAYRRVSDDKTQQGFFLLK